ncbi:phosphatidate cytidylyltransferase [Parvibaculum sp.]|uniref:phosphatidate cytidylyltransferase n=1 Tax=Parvibaculum sp. TaxID=2024848 RepID=UPI0027365864|nr:phosphatidate cytidylyltransferase [Parvibaculum sp.]MDP3327457.1 phosphatidate cytidylyltransferase [Parvibaculum sp.]
MNGQQDIPRPEPMAPKASDLRVRIVSALVLAPVVLGAVWLGGWAFSLLLALAAVLMAHEIAGLLFGGGGPRRTALLAGTALVVVALASVGLTAAALAAAAAGLAFALAARSWTRDELWPALIAYPYLLLPLISLIWLRADSALGLAVVFWLLATVWAIDICAYFAGRFIGGPKLAPRISPKKTWAGLVGGILGAMIVAIVTSLWIGEGAPLLLALIAAALAVLEQVGDFAESALKRRAGVKDSGTLIPGHGGILDRVDGLVAVAVGAAILALIHNSAEPAAGVLIWP